MWVGVKLKCQRKDCDKPAIRCYVEASGNWQQPLYFPSEWLCEEHSQEKQRDLDRDG